MPTLLVFTVSPADRAAPQKLAYQEIAGSAGDTERPETGPGVERARIHPLALLSSPPVRVMGLAALCTTHISAIRCTLSGQSLLILGWCRRCPQINSGSFRGEVNWEK